MIKFATGLLVLSLLAGCANTAPARSKCFSNGRVSCKFTPIDQLWGTPNAALNP